MSMRTQQVEAVSIDPYVLNHDWDMRLINDHFINANDAANRGWASSFEHTARTSSG